jgi:hypothetical protein
MGGQLRALKRFEIDAQCAAQTTSPASMPGLLFVRRSGDQPMAGAGLAEPSWAAAI